MSEPISLFVLGLLVLAVGAELLARGFGWVARAFGSGRLIDRLAVAAASVCAPVLAVCLATAFSGYPRVAIATVIGANIANVGLVLGVAALARPLASDSRLVRQGIVLFLSSTLLVWFLVRDNALNRPAGIVLLVGFALFAVLMMRFTRTDAAAAPSPLSTTPSGSIAASGVGWLGAVLLLAGIAALLVGAALVARSLAGLVPETGVGGITVALTAIAPAATFRTLAASIVAARRREADVVLGGAIGGSVLNLLLALGVTALVVTIPVPERLLMHEFPAASIAAAMLVAVLAAGMMIPRYHGLILLAAYLGFMVWELAR